MPLSLGGLGVGGTSRMCDAAHWGSWADFWRWYKTGIPKSQSKSCGACPTVHLGI